MRVCGALAFSSQAAFWLAVAGQMSRSAAPHRALAPGKQEGMLGLDSHRAVLAQAQHPCIPVCGPFSGPVLVEGTLQGYTAVLSSPFILVSLEIMADILYSFWA